VRKRFGTALLVYAVLLCLAIWLLEGKFLAAVLILFGGLLAKTLLALRTESSESAADQTNPGDSVPK
jgi:hypothetical protein